jgi:hypothetical protein
VFAAKTRAMAGRAAMRCGAMTRASGSPMEALCISVCSAHPDGKPATVVAAQNFNSFLASPYDPTNRVINFNL